MVSIFHLHIIWLFVLLSSFHKNKILQIFYFCIGIFFQYIFANIVEMLWSYVACQCGLSVGFQRASYTGLIYRGMQLCNWPQSLASVCTGCCWGLRESPPPVFAQSSISTPLSLGSVFAEGVSEPWFPDGPSFWVGLSVQGIYLAWRHTSLPMNVYFFNNNCHRVVLYFIPYTQVLGRFGVDEHVPVFGSQLRLQGM